MVNNSSEKGVETRQKAYSLIKFLKDCKSHQNKVFIDRGAIESAGESPLHLSGKKEILNFLGNCEGSKFNYVNTRVYKKGVGGIHPSVDSYKVEMVCWDLYVSFCLVKLKEENKWYIKSFHSDKSGETISIGDLVTAKISRE